MKQIIKEYFTFNKRERYGIFVLITLIIIVYTSKYILKHQEKLQKTVEISANKEVYNFEINQKKIKDSIRNLKQKYLVKTKFSTHLTPFFFNPNNLPVEQWEKLGLKNWQIKIIKNYEAKGGRFNKSEDFKKIYGISEMEYNILSPFIVIQQQKSITYNKSNISKKYNYFKIDINSADTSELMRFRGIGPSFANRIIKYRKLLGGYFSKEQLLEVYGMDTSRFKMFSDNVSINIDSIHKININSANFKRLIKHPYINYDIAVALINYKKRFGNFKSIKDITLCKPINDSIYNKLSNYLTIK